MRQQLLLPASQQCDAALDGLRAPALLRGSQLAGELRFDALPVFAEALDWVKQGVATGASERNWKRYGADVQLPLPAINRTTPAASAQILHPSET